jgi:hypothetical protein
VFLERAESLKNDVSLSYLKGAKYSRSWTDSFNVFGLESKLAKLYHLYPYQNTIKSTHRLYHEKKESAIVEGLIITALSWYNVE